MQVSSVASVPISEFWAAGSAPLLEIIPDADPFKPRECWEELRHQFGNRVTTEIVTDASHPLFPEQPDRVADVFIAFCHRLMSDGGGKARHDASPATTRPLSVSFGGVGPEERCRWPPRSKLCPACS